MRALAILFLSISTLLGADNVRFVPVPSGPFRPPPPTQACPTNVIISGILGPPATYAFLFPSTCTYTNNGVNYKVGPCSLSQACTNTSQNSIVVSNATPGVVGIVTIQTRNGNYSTNLVLGTGFTGAQFFWGLSCTLQCTNCSPFVCVTNQISAGN
jgi:hypothetical protein